MSFLMKRSSIFKFLSWGKVETLIRVGTKKNLRGSTKDQYSYYSVLKILQNSILTTVYYVVLQVTSKNCLLSFKVNL